MATMYYEKDCDLSLIKDRPIAVIGYGSQGHAHALNLHDSGCDVRVGLRTGSASWDTVKDDGLKVVTPREAAAEADIVMMLTPDETQAHVYYTENAEGHTVLRRVPVAGGESDVVWMSEQSLQNFAMDPGGQWVAYSIGENEVEVWVMENLAAVLSEQN